MIRMAKSLAELKDDPRTVRDPVVFNRLRLMVFEEAIDRAWGCPLYILHRTRWLTNEQREAGDRYQQITMDYHRGQMKDPDEAIPEARSLIYRRVERQSHKWHESTRTLAGCRWAVDRVVLDESYPASEREKVVLRLGLQLLSDFYITGRTKRVRG